MVIELPADLDAERYVIAAMMHSARAAEAAVETGLEQHHFHRAAHGILFRVLVMMWAADVIPDPVTIRDWVTTDGELRSVGGPQAGPVFLFGLYQLPAVADSVTHYARLVLAAALRRDGIAEAQRLVHDLSQPENDPDRALSVIDHRLEQLRLLARPAVTEGTDLRSVTELRAKLAAPVAPGLLHAEERVVVVGGEGRGKTTLAHQFGFTVAAGVHPFRWQTRIEPRRVTVADFENPRDELAHRFAHLAEIGSGYPGWSEGNLDFYLRPGGINLASARDAFAFMDAIRRHAPALVIAGPIYKLVDIMIAAGVEPLRAHSRVTTFFDQVRARFGCAIWLETHAPAGQAGHVREMRPEGSNVWMKWPEFRLALYKATKSHGGDSALDVKRFAGDRVEGRAWPSWLTRNSYSGWPWVANYSRNVVTAEPATDD